MVEEDILEKRERVQDIINPFGTKEPKWNDIDVTVLHNKARLSILGSAYNWYSYNATPMQHKKWVLEYCKNNPGFTQDDTDILESVNEKRFIPYGPTLRIFMNNGPIQKSSLSKINIHIKDLIEEHSLIHEEKVKQNKIKQLYKIEKEHEHTSNLISEFEEKVHSFIIDKSYKFNFNYNDWVAKNNVPKKVHLHIIERWNQVKDELTSTEPDCIEAYSHIPYKKKLELISFLESLAVTEQVEEVPVKRTRTKKPKSAAKQIKKLKYMDNFQELNLKSINPEKIIGATNLWVYNTQYKILFNYVAEKDKSFEIKGTTLLNFDENLSVGKRLRKPEEVLTTILNGGKIVFRKTFEGLKTKPIKTTGRINEHCILLKAF